MYQRSSNEPSTHCKLNLVTMAIRIGSCYPNHDICSLARHNYLTRCHCTTIVSIELILVIKQDFDSTSVK